MATLGRRAASAIGLRETKGGRASERVLRNHSPDQSSAEEARIKTFARARSLSQRLSSHITSSYLFLNKGNGPDSQSPDSYDHSLLSCRVQYRPKSLRAKEAALRHNPGLTLDSASEESPSKRLVACGVNSLRAEVLDMNAMLRAMIESKRVLTHAAVERFFAWLPIFSVYVERYMYVEEDIIVSWIEDKAGKLKGPLRASKRMELRGKIQKAISDVDAVQASFVHSLPAGERLERLVRACEAVTELVVDYTTKILCYFPPAIDQHYSKQDIEKIRCRLVKYVVAHVGAKDFLALYTRWMTPKQLTQWKTRVLVPADFKFLSYGKWEKDMRDGHYVIPANFAEVLAAETEEDEDHATEWRENFKRAQSSNSTPHEDGEMSDYEDNRGDAGICETTLDAQNQRAHTNTALSSKLDVAHGK